MIWALHGFLGAPSDWSIPLQGLKSKIQLIDLSRYVSQCPDLESLAASLNNDIFAQDSNPVLVGYSMGARIALHQLLQTPTEFKAAVLVSPHFGLNTVSDRALRVRADEKWTQKLLDLKREDFLNEWNAQPVFSTADSNTARENSHAGQNWKPSLCAQMLHQWGLGRQSYLYPRLAEIKCPLLWVTGQDDDKFAALAQSAATQNSAILNRSLPKAGHRVPWQNPTLFSELITRFLESKNLDRRAPDPS